MRLSQQSGLFICLLALLTLASCVTPYQPVGFTGGYSEEPLGGDRWHISVEGNSFTPIQAIEPFFFKRAEEIAKENGYDGYVVETLRKTQEYGPGGVHSGLQPRIRGTIRCYKGPKPSSLDAIYKKDETSISLGTGWKIAKGYVVTNNHVIEKASKVYLIVGNGERIDARVLARDRANDLAVLSVDDLKLDAPAIPISKQQLGAGAKVFTVGYPHPTLMGASPKVADGIVSAATGLLDDPRTYQITVPLQTGNSGGPLLNMKGEAIGIVTYKLNAATVFQWTGDLPENVNYAIKIQYLEPLISGFANPGVLSNKAEAGDLENLAKKVMGSVFIVVAQQ